jgi:hypothetical protein
MTPRGAICKTCGGDLPERRGRGRPAEFCSAKCRNVGRRAHRRPVFDRVCAACAMPFRTMNAKTRCCSDACGGVLARRSRLANAMERRHRVCETCCQPFVMRSPSGKALAGKVREGRFCSRLCAATWRTRRHPVQGDLFSCSEVGEARRP